MILLFLQVEKTAYGLFDLIFVLTSDYIIRLILFINIIKRVIKVQKRDALAP